MVLSFTFDAETNFDVTEMVFCSWIISGLNVGRRY